MKELLLAKSNIRKSKGLTIGLILLIMLASCFFNVVLLLFTDYNKNADKQAEKLNAQDANLIISGNIAQIEDEYIASLMGEEVEAYEISKQVGASLSTPYGDGTVNPFVTIGTVEDIKNNKIGVNEVMEEDETIVEDFIYLPYQYHTGGKFNLGDNYEIKILDKTYNLKVKGFINNLVLGSYSSGTIQIAVSDNIYKELSEQNELKNIVVRFDLKDDVNATKFINKFADQVLKDNEYISINIVSLENAIYTRTYLSIIFGVGFLVIGIIIILVVMLMLSNNISNYIKENIKILGAIKALGYTNREVKTAFLMQFVLISILGCFIGIALSYVLGPAVTNIMTAQSGIPYSVTFSLISTILTFIISIMVVILTVLFFLRKTKNIEPITALRQGISTHNFKKNRIPLEKSKLSTNVSLALKTTFTNIKQNIVTFVITFFLIFIGVVSLTLYQNFSVDPKITLLSFEICSGAIMTDGDLDKEVYDYIDSIEGVKNTRLVTSQTINIEEVRVSTYIVDDAKELNNKDVCYKGRLPEYDNEIALSGKMCKIYNYNIGDEVEAVQGNKTEKFLITGFIQTTNNNGQEGVLLKKGAEKVLGEDFNKMYYFDADEGIDVDECINNVKDKFGDRIFTTVNFDETVKGSISIFKLIAGSMVILVLTISALVIFLVLYLLIKTLINNKKKDYGILKAIGYTSKDIMLQNAISFMPTIIFSVIISCIASTFLVNPYLGVIMGMFGIMKLTLDVPVLLIILMGIGFVAISFAIAMLLSRKIIKIEPYKLLTEE